MQPRGAALVVVVALHALGCQMLGLGSQDPMRAELRRLEKEQRTRAAEEQILDKKVARERAENPLTMEQLLARGDKHLAEGRSTAAIWDYGSAYELDPKAAAPRERLGYVLLRSDPQRAQPLFESALEREPDSVSGHVGLGLAMLAGKEHEAGLRHLERAVELDPKSAKAQAALGVSLDQLGRREDAITHLEAAHDLRPHDSRILNNLGVAYLRAGQPERAETLVRAALREDQRDLALRTNNLGMALAMQGKFSEALAEFRKTGDEQSARSNLGYAHSARGEYDRAIEEYEKALLAGGKANVDVVRNLQAARHAREIAQRDPSQAPVATPPVSTPGVDPAGIADEDGAVGVPASRGPE